MSAVLAQIRVPRKIAWEHIKWVGKINGGDYEVVPYSDLPCAKPERR